MAKQQNGHTSTTSSEMKTVQRPAPTPEGLSERERAKYELPVDHGYAWVICLAGFMTYFIMGIGNQATAVMFVQVLELHNTNITTGSLIFTSVILSLSISSVVSTNFILPRVGEKVLVFAAGLLFSTASLLYSTAPNIWVFIAAAVVSGTGAGCAFVSSLNLHRHYFHKRRFLATTLGNVGTSVAEIAIPPAISVLSSKFGVRGTYLIVSALQLHIVAAALLLRPIQAYKYRPVLAPLKKKALKKKKKKDENDDETGSHEQDRKTELHTMEANGVREGQGEVTKSLLNSEDREKENGEVHGDANRPKDRNDEDTEDERLEELRRYASAMSLSDDPAPQPAILTADKPRDKEQSKGCWDKINNSVLGLWTFRLVILSTIPCGVNHYIRLYVPTVAKSQGATMDQAAIVVTVMGSVALVSRLATGLFADTHILRPSQILVLSQIGLGIVCQLVRFFTTFGMLIVMGVGLGLFVGTRLTLTPMLSLEVAGIERLPQAFSIMAMVHTLVGAAVNPLFGAIVETTGNFEVAFHIAGACLIIGSLLLIPLPLMVKQDIKSGKRKPDH